MQRIPSALPAPLPFVSGSSLALFAQTGLDGPQKLHRRAQSRRAKSTDQDPANIWRHGHPDVRATAQGWPVWVGFLTRGSGGLYLPVGGCRAGEIRLAFARDAPILCILQSYVRSHGGPTPEEATRR